MNNSERTPTLAERKQAVLIRERDRALHGMYDKKPISTLRRRVGQFALGAFMTVGVIGLAASLIKGGESEPAIKPDPIPHLLQPNERLDTIAAKACEHVPTDEVITFILDQSGIDDSEIGTLQPGTALIVPLEGSC